jgi:uncharacterized membrane protein
MRPHPFLVLALVGALIGFIFAGVSTYGFEQHLDRQVHNVHCSFVPGLDEADAGGSDCEVTLMSQYSSVLRSSTWGGVPISLPAMSVFAFLLFFGIDLLVGRRQRDRRATGFYALAALLPVLASVVMGYIALSELDAACKSCIGIYVASAMVLTGALGMWVRARGEVAIGGAGAEISDPEWASDEEEGGSDSFEAELAEISGRRGSGSSAGPMSFGMLGAMFGLGLVFVAVPVGAYMASAPDHSRFVGACGELDEQPDQELLINMGPQTGVPALEIFDPLCPACRGFEEHLEQTVYHDKLARKAILFPLDDECNWMLDQAVHPGACAVSEAVLCAEDGADRVIAWAFANQEQLLETAGSSGGSDKVRAMIAAEFPALDGCVGSPKVRARLNQSLRWAVEAELRVLTPQLYVDGVRLCDEDVDLGLEFALSTMLERHANGTLHSTGTPDSTGSPGEQP